VLTLLILARNSYNRCTTTVITAVQSRNAML